MSYLKIPYNFGYSPYTSSIQTPPKTGFFRNALGTTPASLATYNYWIHEYLESLATYPLPRTVMLLFTEPIESDISDRPMEYFVEAIPALRRKVMTWQAIDSFMITIDMALARLKANGYLEIEELAEVYLCHEFIQACRFAEANGSCELPNPPNKELIYSRGLSMSKLSTERLEQYLRDYLSSML